MADKAEKKVAELGNKLDEAVNKAEEQLTRGLKQADAALKPQVRALKAVMSNKNFKKIYGRLPPEQQETLLTAMNFVGETGVGEKFTKKMNEFENALKACEGRACVS